MTDRRSRKRSIFFGAAAGIIAHFFAGFRKKSAENLKKHDFPTSTQRSGMRFNEKIRDRFRAKWLKKK